MLSEFIGLFEHNVNQCKNFPC